MKLEEVEAQVLKESNQFICEYENAGYCNKPGKCKDKGRIYKEGPRGGMVKTNDYICDRAL